MKSYRREREGVEEKEKELKRKRSYRREREGVRTIGLDWLLGMLLGGWRGLGRILKGLVFLAWSSPHSFSHSPLS